MKTVIETNLSFNSDGELVDFQSRSIEVDNWDNYVNEIKNEKSIHLPKRLNNGIKMKDFKADYFHLSCDLIYSNSERKIKKLAYLMWQ